MADFDNFSEINENFDTIKTLLNSIRAQGILNTSDVDKLLSGINSKLEKLNTEEDIDLIKIFLSELKQNFEERHGVLVSKFAAIESLFTNLLKNSSEMPKSSELKELFDIVATNLSVFSREVVSQKESLTEISLRLDALRSDDTQKKEIIKNIAVLKSDLERLSNGFDSIVISLNDNFKTVVKTITSIDKTEYLDRFSDSLTNIEMSSNTVLSALQLLGKKTEQVEDVLVNLATKDDITTANQKLFELSAQGHEITSYISDLNDRYTRLDNLTEKIDASVNIIATLKAVMEENEDKNARAIVEELRILEADVKNIAEDTKLEEFKLSLESILKKIIEGAAGFENELKINNNEILNLAEQLNKLDFSIAISEISNDVKNSATEIQNITDLLKKIDPTIAISDLSKDIKTTESEIKKHINETSQKTTTLQDANISRVLSDITSNAESLGSKINQTQNSIAALCEKNFGHIFENINELKSTVSQLDENTVSANNAIFSSITDRLTSFETSLRDSLETQELTVTNSSAQLIEQIENIKNLAGVLDYKMDSSVVEVGNVKREFSTLKTAVEDVLALDFVSVVKDLRVDLYASKQELTNCFENSSNELSEKFTSDLYGKYELLISKLDTIEDELKASQTEALTALKPVLENITSSLVDVLSYVSERKTEGHEFIEAKLSEISNTINENSVAYVENVRDIVDVIRAQVETNLKNLEEDYLKATDDLKTSVKECSQDIKNDIKYSYSKLLEIQDSYNEIKEIINVNNINNTGRFDSIISSAESIKTDFESRISKLKNSLIDKISEFKQEFTFDNAEKVNELRFSVENLYTKNSTDIVELLNVLKRDFSVLSTESSDARNIALNKILDNVSSLKEFINNLDNKSSENLSEKVSEINNELAKVKEALEKIDENIDADITRQLSIVESNFETLMSQITILFDKSEITLSSKIDSSFTNATEIMETAIVNKLSEYKENIEKTFEEIEAKAISQSDYLQKCIADLNIALKDSWVQQATTNSNQLNDIADSIKELLESNANISKEEYASIKTKLSDLIADTALNNEQFIQEMQTKLNDLEEKINSDSSNFENKLSTGFAQLKTNINANIQEESSKIYEASENLAQKQNDNFTNLVDLSNRNHESIVKLENNNQENFVELKNSSNELSSAIASNKTMLIKLEESLADKISSLKALLADASAGELQTLDAYVNTLQESILASKKNAETCKDLIIQFLQKELALVSQNVEKETDTIVAELIEQFEILKQSQNGEIVDLTSKIEDIVNTHVYNNIEDLKSYLDVKTDSSNLIAKVDNLKIEMTQSISDVLHNISKLLEAGVFNNTIKEFKTANEILINSSTDRLNEKIENFISENSEALASKTDLIKEKLGLFDTKFTDIIVKKFEEIKTISLDYSDSLTEVQNSINEILVEFAKSKSDVNSKIDELALAIKTSSEATNKEIEALTKCFADLRSQISSKSFDEAFQASINKQIGELEKLLSEQLSYIEDINELCANNLPDVSELNTLVKHTVLSSIDDFSSKIDNVKDSVQDVEYIIEKDIKDLKSELITQILNVFNQISFITEEEEILDFIQDKHDELITILSHIVTSTNDIFEVKKNIQSVDKKVTNIKDEISLINNKINSIISADGDVDYIYSLHDLEADIANLRLALNEIKENNNSNEFTNLINSTNEIYTLVEAIKDELPSQKAINGIAEDIVSISTRTNKLILASDESYKTLQENLQEFKLVIDDLDERTRNFSRESGLDRIDSKLNSINTMMVNGSKTNQIFNQVFEYLAEWVDNASVQINTITDKVETLDEISQIKTMLAEMKSDAADNTETEELVEALGTVFNKQTKRISSLETKLDRIIVDNTINKDRKIDMTPLEDTLNRFLVSIDEKMIAQQQKIDSLEAKIESIQAEKETAQLTKKVGGMDRQIAKLNKSIEKIASHVIDK